MGKGIASDVSGIERRDSVTRDATADFTLDLAGETVDEPMYRKWFAPSETQTGWQSTNAKGSVSLADHTAAEHCDLLGHEVEGESLLGGDDAPADLETREGARVGTGGEDHVGAGDVDR